MKSLINALKRLFCKTDVRRSFSIEETKALYIKAYKTAWDVMAGSDNMKGMTSQKLGKDLDEDINNFWWRDTGLE